MEYIGVLEPFRKKLFSEENIRKIISPAIIIAVVDCLKQAAILVGGFGFRLNKI